MFSKLFKLLKLSYLKDLQNPLHTAIDIDALLQIVIDDDDVQFWWALVCSSLDNDLSEILLRKIVKLWITLRGFFYCSSIMEQYKQCTKDTLKKKRALRKNLRLKSVTDVTCT